MRKPLIIVTLFLVITFITACGGKKPDIPGQPKPGTPEYKLNEALFYLGNQRFVQAESLFNQVLKKRKNNTTALNGLGLIYLHRRDFVRAEAQFKKVLTVDQKFIDAYNSLGIVYIEMGKPVPAKENLLIAANSPDYATPENSFLNIAKLEYNRKKYSAALRYVKQGLRLNQEFIPLVSMKALIYEAMDELDEALRYYEKGLAKSKTKDPALMMNIGRVYIKMGRKNDAINILEQAISITTDMAQKRELSRLITEAEEI